MTPISLMVLLAVIALIIVGLQHMPGIAQPPWLRGALVVIACFVGVGWLLWGPRF